MKNLKNKLLLLARTNADKPQEIKVQAAADGVDVYMKGVISADFGIGADSLRDALHAAAGAPVNLYINSPGGDAFEGREMQAMIAAYKAPVTAIVTGMAASAATIVTMAASTVKMSKGSRYMIHNGWTLTMGDRHAHGAVMDLLTSFDGELAAEYAAKTGKTLAQAVAWMDAETWFTADQAKEAGFADEVLGNTQNTAMAVAWNLSAYANAPDADPGVAQTVKRTLRADLSDALSARQAAMYEAAENAAEDFGKFDQTSGAAGAHYMAASPFAAEGIKCANCALYAGQRQCEVVAGDIDPEAVCKLWIIPEAVLQQQTVAASAQTDRILQLNRSRLAALFLPN